MEHLVLTSLLSYLDATSMLRLSTCSKHLSSSVTSYLQHSLQAPLVSAVVAAAKEHQEHLEQR